MSMPVLTVEAAFGVNPGTVPGALDWVDLTSRVGYPGGIVWRYGRSHERDQADAGTGTIVFDNSDRALDPTYTGSPYYPNVKPLVQIRVTATHETVDYPVLYAYAEGWPPLWEGTSHGWVTVPLVDGMKLLSMARTSAAYPQAVSGARVGALLDAAGWPAGARDLDPGRSLVAAYDASQRIVLNAIREAADTEAGLFFIGPNGNAVFLDRDHWGSTTPSFTFNETTLPYEQVHPSYDDTTIWNDIGIRPAGLGVARAVDQTSIDQYGHRWLERLEIPLVSQLVASDMAHWLLNRYAHPRLRVDQLVLEGDLFSGEGGTPDVLEPILTSQVGTW